MSQNLSIFLMGCLLIPPSLFGQVSRTRHAVWVTPVGNNDVTINGLAVGLMALPGQKGHLRINGLNVELVPVAALCFATLFLTPGAILDSTVCAEEADTIRTVIHGVSISGGMFEEVEMHGVSLSFISYVGSSHGLEMSLFTNSNYLFSGIQLSMWGNRAVKGKGLQVGIFNSCNDCSGLQIGFLNRMGKRVLPLINFRFKKKSKEKSNG